MMAQSAAQPAQPAQPARPAQRSEFRAVALPSEHGGWGLTIEPGLLGLLVEPSASGVCLAAAALVAFLLRTPLKLALVDRRRGRRLPRTALAERVAAVEFGVLVALIGAAVATANGNFWWLPLLVAFPLVVVGLAYDIRSRSRRLIPELAGAVAIAAIAAAIVLADGGDAGLAYGLWFLLAARVVTSVPHVRTQIARLHDRSTDRRLTAVTDLAAVGLGSAAVALSGNILVGAILLVGIIGFQLIRRQQPVAPVKVIGIGQMVLGLALVVATAIGVAVI